MTTAPPSLAPVPPDFVPRPTEKKRRYTLYWRHFYKRIAPMADSSSSPPVSLELLIHEIEAMPREYWTELLDALRHFREKIPSTTPPVINAEQAKKNQAAIDLLNSWLSETEDASEHQQA